MVPDRPAGLPGAVLDSATDSTALGSLVTDGTAYAWDAGGAIAWWSAGERAVRTRVPNAVVSEVAGPLVFYFAENSSTVHVLDIRTGAQASIANDFASYATGGVVFLENDPRRISNKTRFTITRLDTSTLPPLSC